MNERFQRALKGLTNPTPPIWFMRQAGRYHSHYQNLRKQHSFVDLCKNPDLAAEVALGPIEEFDFDTAILFSDLLFPLEALGMGLVYDPGPKLGQRLNFETIRKLKPISDALPQLEFQHEAMVKTRARLPKDKSLIGFVGGPWTLFTYAVEGGHHGALSEAKKSSRLYQQFGEIILPLLIGNIEMQLSGGAEVVMIFDTAAGELSADQFRTWCEPQLQQLVNLFPGQLGYYAKTASEGHLLGLKGDSRWAGFGYDHRWDLSAQLKQRPFGFVQGNFDQALLHSDESDLDLWIEKYLLPLKKLSVEQRNGWVSGLGHGVLPATPEKAVHKLIRTIRQEFK